MQLDRDSSRPKVHQIVVAHMMPEIIAFSLWKGKRTSGFIPDTITILDNRWPMEPDVTAASLMEMAQGLGARLIRPEKNLGGHGGFSAAIEVLRQNEVILPGDLILGYDPDTNPIAQGWLKAMVETMIADPELGHLSLMHEHLTKDRPWQFREAGGHKIAYMDRPEMQNCTIWRENSLVGGLKGLAKFYGFSEVCSFDPNNLMKQGYLWDFREDLCPIQHPHIYNVWKGEHAVGKYPGNFDEYLANPT